MLQAFRLNDTCRCITTSTSITQTKNYTCGTSTVWVVGTWHHSTAGTSALGMIWTTSTTTFHNPHQRLRQITTADVDSTLNIWTLLVASQHFTNYFSALFMLVAFVQTLSDVHDVFLLRLPGILLSLWPCLECAVSLSVLTNFSSIVSFFCVSLGPWCILLRLATSHPSQLARVRIFLRS